MTMHSKNDLRLRVGALALKAFTADELVAVTGCKESAVRSFLARNAAMFTSTPVTQAGRSGRRRLLYELTQRAQADIGDDLAVGDPLGALRGGSASAAEESISAARRLVEVAGRSSGRDRGSALAAAAEHLDDARIRIGDASDAGVDVPCAISDALEGMRLELAARMADVSGLGAFPHDRVVPGRPDVAAEPLVGTAAAPSERFVGFDADPHVGPDAVGWSAAAVDAARALYLDVAVDPYVPAVRAVVRREVADGSIPALALLIVVALARELPSPPSFRKTLAAAVARTAPERFGSALRSLMRSPDGSSDLVLSTLVDGVTLLPDVCVLPGLDEWMAAIAEGSSGMLLGACMRASSVIPDLRVGAMVAGGEMDVRDADDVVLGAGMLACGDAVLDGCMVLDGVRGPSDGWDAFGSALRRSADRSLRHARSAICYAYAPGVKPSETIAAIFCDRGTGCNGV